jgi:hypothetical protein
LKWDSAALTSVAGALGSKIRMMLKTKWYLYFGSLTPSFLGALFPP